MVTPIDRILYSYTKPNIKHTLIFICCIHGNEAAGMYGLQRVINTIKEKKINLECNFYAVVGNINAYKKNVRFESKDLNRLWTDEHINTLKSKTNLNNTEDIEQFELLHSLSLIHI